MAINSVRIRDFMVFKGEFSASFCPGVNILIGGNGTGKTSLLKLLYWWVDNHCFLDWEENAQNRSRFTGIEHYFGGLPAKRDVFACVPEIDTDTQEIRGVYIPEKDILEHAKGLLTFIEQKQTGFSHVYRNVLIAAQDIPTQEQSETQQAIGEKLAQIIGGEICWDKGDGSFYTLKSDGSRVPFAYEASGYKKLGFLSLLVSCGQLFSNAVLLWDEPENSLNPELVPDLVDILLDLAKSGTQLFIATHDYNLARYFDVRKDKTVPVMYFDLKKVDGRIICHSAPEYIKLPENLLEKASADLFEAVIDDAMETSDV